jgi:hypothetical protein
VIEEKEIDSIKFPLILIYSREFERGNERSNIKSQLQIMNMTEWTEETRYTRGYVGRYLTSGSSAQSICTRPETFSCRTISVRISSSSPSTKMSTSRKGGDSFSTPSKRIWLKSMKVLSPRPEEEETEENETEIVTIKSKSSETTKETSLKQIMATSDAKLEEGQNEQQESSEEGIEWSLRKQTP